MVICFFSPPLCTHTRYTQSSLPLNIGGRSCLQIGIVYVYPWLSSHTVNMSTQLKVLNILGTIKWNELIRFCLGPNEHFPGRKIRKSWTEEYSTLGRFSWEKYNSCMTQNFTNAGWISLNILYLVTVSGTKKSVISVVIATRNSLKTYAC